MTLLDSFNYEVLKYLTRSSCDLSDNLLSLVRFRVTSGESDFSFPISMKIWRNHMKDINEEQILCYNDNILQYAQESSSEDYQEKFKAASGKWTFSINEIQIKDNRCSITLDRISSYKKVFEELRRNDRYGKSEKDEGATLSLETDGDATNSISDHRAELICNIIKNLLPYSKFVYVNDPAIAENKILVTTKSSLNKNHSQSNRKLLTCGVVTQCSDKKVAEALAEDYLKHRSNDMHLISIHRYGQQTSVEEMERFGKYAVTLDLLQVKPASTIMLTPNPNQAFILYNSARLETLLKKYKAKVDEGYYQKLPNFNAIDFSLLKEEEEWDLLKLMLIFPDIINRSIIELPNGKVALHLVHKFLTDVANTFSVYYRRVRLLTENRAQLIPELHAKIYFLQQFRRIYNEALAIFCIPPIEFM